LSDRTWFQLGEIFHAALDLTPQERDGFLARACADDEALRTEIDEMLNAHEGQTRLHVEDRLLSEGDVTDAMLGQSIGAYRMVELLGRGGMGNVYLAERDDDQYERRVAFKLIRPGLTGRGATERFLRERQILAQLEHPNIAMLLDGGVTADDRPYLVMQYVDGKPITEWCREQKLTVRERLELFITVCDTVQAAHNNLVVHRDLKPANILVTNDGQVRLLDFGIAKLLNEADPSLTLSLDRILTPAHAAPEQVTGRPVTTATDVYALGVLVYEMLTDERPFAVDQSSAAAIERSICNTPPVPPSHHSPHLKGEVENIVLMALRKESVRRYPSARELGEDVAHHLEGRPVRAQGDSVAYRARKALGRHRWATGTVEVFLLTVAIAMGAVTRESQRRLAERDRALAEQARADAVVHVMSDLLARSNPANLPDGGLLTRDNFISMLGEAVDGLDDQPAVQARLRELMAQVHQAHGRNEEWLAAIEEVAAYHREVGSGPHKMAAIEHTRARAIHEVKGVATAEPLLRESLERHRRLFGPLHLNVGIAAQDLAQVLFGEKPEEAAKLMNEAFSIAQVSGAADSLAMARIFNGMGNQAVARGDWAGARDNYDRALVLLEPYLGAAHPHVMVVTYNLALTLRQPEELARAESLLRRNRQRMESTHGPRTKNVARSWEALGVVLALQGRPAEALEAYDSAVAIQAEAHGPNSLATANPLVKAATMLMVMDRPEEALDRFARVRTMEAARQGSDETPDPFLEAFGHSLEALALYEARRPTESLKALAELASWLEAAPPAGRSWILAEMATVKATVLLAEGRFADAKDAARLALDARLKEESHMPRLVARNYALLAAALAGTGRSEEARSVLSQHGESAFACGYLTPLQRRLLHEALASLGP